MGFPHPVGARLHPRRFSFAPPPPTSTTSAPGGPGGGLAVSNGPRGAEVAEARRSQFRRREDVVRLHVPMEHPCGQGAGMGFALGALGDPPRSALFGDPSWFWRLGSGTAFLD